MKKWVCFLLGLITGSILTIVVLFCIGKSMQNTNAETTETTESSSNSLPGLVLFEQPGEEFSAPSFKVIQVLYSNTALAISGEEGYGQVDYYGTVVLLIGDEATHYYDDQIIEVPKGRTARHTGTYQYETRDKFMKTVPVIQFIDNK